jgi:hypothetical protein
MACCEWCMNHFKLEFATTNNLWRFPDEEISISTERCAGESHQCQAESFDRLR